MKCFNLSVNSLRVFSSVVLCVAYIVTLYYNQTLGSQIYLIGNFMAMPYMIKNKCWDVVALLSFFILVGIPKAIGN